ncbi:LOW QUALITY PROTEIN: hypothetical protein HID58_041182 [Brassica napus]|uniref:Uncharacterized protein n=1 Tax=Brassica napus TaxID=3708 RepID=A0ABQ8BA39_BRANA|nr:LOW QUALITY PROTEIN: hypothetical protein HID58_041182 [Brassica napus]
MEIVAVSSVSPYQKQNVSISVYGIKLNTNNDALFTTLFHLRHRPAVSDLAANVKPTIALSLRLRALSVLKPETLTSILDPLSQSLDRFSLAGFAVQDYADSVTNGSSNGRDGLSVSELLMSPEIFKAVNNGGIQKLFPIHACIGNRKKGETVLMYVTVNGKKLVDSSSSEDYSSSDSEEEEEVEVPSTALPIAGAAASSVVKSDSKPKPMARLGQSVPLLS